MNEALPGRIDGGAGAGDEFGAAGGRQVGEGPAQQAAHRGGAFALGQSVERGEGIARAQLAGLRPGPNESSYAGVVDALAEQRGHLSQLIIDGSGVEGAGRSGAGRRKSRRGTQPGIQLAGIPC